MISYGVDSEVAKRNAPELRAEMRALNRSGGASIAMPKTARHTASRQYDMRSCVRMTSVDQNEQSEQFELSSIYVVALSTMSSALRPKIDCVKLCRCAALYTAHRQSAPPRRGTIL